MDIGLFRSILVSPPPPFVRAGSGRIEHQVFVLDCIYLHCIYNDMHILIFGVLVRAGGKCRTPEMGD